MDELIPLSVLELDLEAPPDGWASFLASRGIAVKLDDVGRRSITKHAARLLFRERAEAEERQREARELAERRAIEADEQRRAQLWGGIPAAAIPEGVHPATAMLVAAQEARPRRQSVLEHALGNSGSAVFHPIREYPAEIPSEWTDE